MRPENLKMKNLLAHHGLDVVPKYIRTGSLKGTWRLYGKAPRTAENCGLANWWDSVGLWARLTELGFTDFDGKPLNKCSGNGGLFSVFTRYNKTKELLF